MQTTYEKYVEEREENRKKYFETDGYHKLSEIVDANPFYYQRMREQAVIRSLITGKRTNSETDFAEIMQEHINDPKVNWQAIYDYVNGQIKQVPTTETLLIGDLIEVKIQLKPYENQVLNVYTGF